MIITRLRGGLGNQMFQYAFGKQVSFETGGRLKADLSWFRSPGAKKPKRNYALDIFNLDLAPASKLEIFFVKVFGKNMLESTPPWKPESKNTYLDGFWQDAGCFKQVEAELRRDFSFKEPALETSVELLSDIKQEGSVCINVRRDDFVRDGKILGVEYYDAAVKKMIALFPHVSFFIFSDDISWCRENLSFIPGAIFIGHEHAGREFSNYMRLMVACQHFIIPNSTFAWWAAWLGDRPKKTVVAPRGWPQGGAPSIPNIIPTEWIQL